MKLRSKYWPLFSYLQKRDQEEVTLSFTEIETLLSSRLPGLARKSRAWWSNRSGGTVQASAWMESGFRIEDVDLEQESVTFRKLERAYTVERKGDTVLWSGELVKGLRLHLGMSQAQLAEELGVRQQTISEWETGVYSPSLRASKHLNLVAKETKFKYGESE